MEHSVAALHERHPPHNWEFANAAERNAQALTIDAVGKTALMTDDHSVWRCIGAVAGSASWETAKAVPFAHTHALGDIVGLSAQAELVTWASRPLASARAAGSLIRIVDGRYQVFVNIAQQYWHPVSGSVVMGSASIFTLTGSTAETQAYAVSLPGNFLVQGCQARLQSMYRVTGTAGAKSIYASLDSVATRIHAGALGATILSGQIDYQFKINNAGNFVSPADTSPATIGSFTSADRTVLAPDLTAAHSLILSAQLATSADTIAFHGWSLEILFPSV